MLQDYLPLCMGTICSPELAQCGSSLEPRLEIRKRNSEGEPAGWMLIMALEVLHTFSCQPFGPALTVYLSHILLSTYWLKSDKTSACIEPMIKYIHERMDHLEGSAGAEFCVSWESACNVYLSHSGGAMFRSSPLPWHGRHLRNFLLLNACKRDWQL